ncbi:MAG: UvrD-helicase domain-containing protein [Betaproteobacteria bacterium]|nr:UvrD-helicase domain-containing protein [Betaproteobacteria bacterium]
MSERRAADAAERESALDPTRSFIVQAPAGAGKTGLLIQRYLRLLATVRRPEEILAITFTRKAAGEMKRRVLEALHDARRGLADDAPDNVRRTRSLAEQALARDEERGWRLLENTARLRIQTIDSFNASLTRQMPVLARLGWQPGLVDDARDLFHEAAVRTLALLDRSHPSSDAIAHLLAHLDGDQAMAVDLLAGMLARRDQWLGRDWRGRLERQAIEAAFRAERARLMELARALFPAATVPRLCALLSEAVAELEKAGAKSVMLDCAGLVALPTADEAGRRAWQAIGTLFVKTDGDWRKAVTKALGFPAKNDGGREGAKKDFAALAEDVKEVAGLRQALADLAHLPPATFDDRQWEALSAVVAVLPVAAAQLLVVFAERGEVDHAQIAAGAVQALGDESAPTDLLLALDEHLSHVLVDEFQDTSRSQWSLLSALTAGWVPDDGRTVFAVGDPMQSIYRFREADVGLFLRAWHEGLPNVRFERLRLATNFRSQQGIVDWVNSAFRDILPDRDDESEGAVSLAESTAFHDPLAGEAATWHPFVDEDKDRARDDEARRVVELVQAARAERPGGKVAILVRNRTHLDRIVPALREARFRFRAVDIEQLGERQAIQDLVALTRALSHAADRVAWLAVLRAPWCGLELGDLLALVRGDERTVPELLGDAARLSRLSSDGRERLARASAILAEAQQERLRGTLRERVESAWLALGGPACLAGATDLEDAETFFDRLDVIAEAGELPDPARLEEHLDDLYGAPDLGAGEELQVMTIHKAKGLQFSTVIVPGLDRTPRAGDTPLFRWKARTDGALLMAPVKEAGQDADAAYDYLKGLDAREEAHEVERLFYVAATRAEHRLHLLARVGLDSTNGDDPKVRTPPERSLLGKAWSVARPHFEAAQMALPRPATILVAAPAPAFEDVRWILPAALDVRVAEPAVVLAPEVHEPPSRIEFSWVGETTRQVGTVAHRWLQRIAEDGLDSWTASRVRAIRGRVREELERRGVPDSGRDEAAGLVVTALESAITDERGRWILARHPQAANEVRMHVIEDGRIRLVVMDRVFTGPEGDRWIVDYKTGRHQGANPEAFLDSERDRYADPLRRYARVLGGQPKLGLYFPLIPGWREVEG